MCGMSTGGGNGLICGTHPGWCSLFSVRFTIILMVRRPNTAFHSTYASVARVKHKARLALRSGFVYILIEIIKSNIYVYKTTYDG